MTPPVPAIATQGLPASREDGPAARRGIGVMTPSGNIVVEPVAIGLAQRLPDLSVHFSRVPMSGVDPNPRDYDWPAMMGAARLLADAEPDVLVWAGSKGAAAGIEKDRLLCKRIADDFGIAATTPTLALEALARQTGMRRLALISPYTEAYQARVVGGLERMGFACVAEAHGGLSDNLSYARVGSAAIRAMAREVAAARPDAILAWCTNLDAAPLAAAIEAETSLPFYDATVLGLWAALGLLAVDASPLAPYFGSLFRLHPAIDS